MAIEAIELNWFLASWVSTILWIDPGVMAILTSVLSISSQYWYLYQSVILAAIGYRPVNKTEIHVFYDFLKNKKMQKNIKIKFQFFRRVVDFREPPDDTEAEKKNDN